MSTTGQSILRARAFGWSGARAGQLSAAHAGLLVWCRCCAVCCADPSDAPRCSAPRWPTADERGMPCAPNERSGFSCKLPCAPFPGDFRSRGQVASFFSKGFRGEGGGGSGQRGGRARLGAGADLITVGCRVCGVRCHPVSVLTQLQYIYDSPLLELMC